MLGSDAALNEPGFHASFKPTKSYRPGAVRMPGNVIFLYLEKVCVLVFS